jgi:hypothetical protein
MSFSENELKAIFEAVGFVTINWALMERQLDNCIHLVKTDLGGVRGHPKKPVAFKKKVAYLRKAIKTIKPLQKHKEEALILLSRAVKMSNIRHQLTHGTIEELNSTVLTINKIKYVDSYYAEQHKFDFKKFPALSEELGDLVTQWLHFSKKLLDNRQSLIKEHQKHH